MATYVTETNNLRYMFELLNGQTRYIDIENPTTDVDVIRANVKQLNEDLSTGTGIGSATAGKYSGILVAEDYFTGDTGATVTRISNVSTIKVKKITETNQIT